jgi:hypothetical protein
MTELLHIPARAGAPIACDMSTAEDTPAERLSAYRRLFDRALARRERRTGAVVLAFRAEPGVHEAVADLARREGACCPFLDYRVEAAGDEVVWTIADPGHGADAILDEFHALPGHVGGSPTWPATASPT